MNKIKEAIEQLEKIVCTEGEDAGVVLLSNDSPTYYHKGIKAHVYRYDYFSQLGDALIQLHRTLKEADVERDEWTAGFLCAVVNLLQMYGDSTEVDELLKCIRIPPAEEIEEHDRLILLEYGKISNNSEDFSK